MLNWDDLRVFLAVARAKRIAVAARMLGIDATTVNRRLARLGAQLDRPLFETAGNERRLTEEGRELLAHAEAIEAATTAATTGPGPGGISGHVRLSVAEGLATRILAPAMPGFQAAHPGIRLDLITASGFLNPSKREADVAVMLAHPRSARLRATMLARYRLRLYATADYLDRHGTPTAPASLSEHVLVGYVPEHVHAPELDYLSEIESELAGQLRSTSINVQHGLVASGVGIGILPDFMAAGDPRLKPVLGETVALHRRFWLVTHKDDQATPRIQAVSDWLVGLGRTIS